MQLALLTSALFVAMGFAQPGEPWTGPVVVVYGTDIYDHPHEFRVPDNGPAVRVCKSTINPCPACQRKLLTPPNKKSPTRYDEVGVH